MLCSEIVICVVSCWGALMRCRSAACVCASCGRRDSISVSVLKISLSHPIASPRPSAHRSSRQSPTRSAELPSTGSSGDQETPALTWCWHVGPTHRIRFYRAVRCAPVCLSEPLTTSSPRASASPMRWCGFASSHQPGEAWPGSTLRLRSVFKRDRRPRALPCCACASGHSRCRSLQD